MRLCEYCGATLRANKRPTAKYCTTRCRVAAHRANALNTLKTLPQWVNHDQHKRPINPNTGKYARANDPHTWATHTQATQHAQQTGHGLGFMLGNGVGCIDLDHCINPDGTLTPGATHLVNQYPDNYIEISPSGTGLHIWGTAPERRGMRTTYQGQPVEFYSRARYITITGNVYQHGHLAHL